MLSKTSCTGCPGCGSVSNLLSYPSRLSQSHPVQRGQPGFRCPVFDPGEEWDGICPITMQRSTGNNSTPRVQHGDHEQALLSPRGSPKVEQPRTLVRLIIAVGCALVFASGVLIAHRYISGDDPRNGLGIGNVWQQHGSSSAPPVPKVWICQNDTDMEFTLNGVPYLPREIYKAMNDAWGAPNSNMLMTLVANGTCGPFVNGPVEFFLRPNTEFVNSTDIPVFRDIFLLHQFSFLDKALANMDINRIMDLGTNTGLSLIYWAQHYPQAKIIGVEPELNNFGMSTINVAGRPNVFLERAAASNKVGFSKLKSMDWGDWAWGHEPVEQLSSSQGFGSVTIPYLMDKYGWETIDYLKVDIEGSELEICQDIAHGAQWIHKIKCVTFEMHDRMRPGIKPSIMDTCHAALKAVGMRFLGHHDVDHLYLWCKGDMHAN